MEDHKNTSDQPEKDDSKWKLRVFYFNPKDKRLFLPKRYGIGWTVNFANPYGIALLIVIVAAIIFLRKLF